MTNHNQTHSNTASLVLCGLFAALTAICSYINIPLGFTPVPINLATLAVFLAGGLLGMKYGTLTMAVYVLMGAVGLPVFSEFQAGIGVLIGPTGGFLIGYIASAFLIGLLLQKRTFAYEQTPSPAKRGKDIALCMAAMLAGLIVCYIMGTAWFMFTTGSQLITAVVACVLPFIPGDLIKIFIASLLVRRLKPVIG